VIVGTDGTALVVYGLQTPSVGGSREVFGRFVDADGSPQGDAFQINTYTGSIQGNPDVCMTADGRFVVVWEDYGYGPGELGESRILARELSGTGVPSGGEVAISTASEGVGFEPRISGNGDRFVVTWPNAPGFEEPAYASADRNRSGVVARTFAVFPDCGDADDTGALAALRTAIVLFACDACVCDVDGSGSRISTDALTLLQRAVGLPHDLTCADCG
jgi:hypothetical protein